MSGFRGWGWRGPGPPVGVPFGLNTQSPQAQGLVAWWPMLGSAQTPYLYDLVRGNTGTLHDSVVYKANANCGSALYFPGTISSYVSLVPINITTSISWAFWANYPMPVADYAMFFFNGQTTHNAYCHILGPTYGVQKGKLYISFIGTQVTVNILSSMYPSYNQWHHIVCTFNNGNAAMFVDAQLVGTNSQAAGPLKTAVGNLTFSSNREEQQSYTGYLGDIRVYNRALSAAEVWQQYDPATRWDLYRPLTRRLWKVGTTASSRRRKLLCGS